MKTPLLVLLSFLALQCANQAWAETDDDWWSDMVKLAAEKPVNPAEENLLTLTSQAKLTLQQVETIALKNVGGQAKEIALKQGNDGKLIYQVDVCNNNQDSNVEIDAGSGTILKVDALQPPKSAKKHR